MESLFTELDEKKFSFFHVKLIIISGMGFFTDSYDLFCIGILTPLLGRIYYQDNPFDLNNTVSPGKLPLNVNVAVSAVALVGTLCGQLIVGHLADVFGRKKIYGAALACMILCAFTQVFIIYIYCNYLFKN
jgi:PHS family inorganic phosphate transporter-like MFS transporter